MLLKEVVPNSVTVVMPYYTMKDKIEKIIVVLLYQQELVATILESLKVDRVITFDLHAGQIQGFFSNVLLLTIYI